MKILIIEDDIETAAYVADGLRARGHETEHIASGDAGLEHARERSHDMLIVDRMLPRLDGISLVTQLRREGMQTPILFLTALGGVDDRVAGLNAGADDYLVKPFALSELVARVNALSRRAASGASESVLAVADVEVDLIARTVTRAGLRIDLQPREFRLLECLVRHANEVVTRKMLLEQVWGFHFDPGTNVVQAHISRLRAKLDRSFDEPLIHTVRGSGYVFGHQS